MSPAAGLNKNKHLDMVKVTPDEKELAGAQYMLHGAFAILEHVLNYKSVFLSVFKDIGLLFFEQQPETIDEDELWELSRVYLKEIRITSSHIDPEFRVTHMTKVLVNPDSETQTILLNFPMVELRYNSDERICKRGLFVLIVKLLHEVANCLTPVFNRWAHKVYNDPVPCKVGTKYDGTADASGSSH